MTINQQPRVPMHALKSSADQLASQGARSATDDASVSAAPGERPRIDAEAILRVRRRQFSNADKRRSLQPVDCSPSPGLSSVMSW